jgi:hypothetical protein
LVHEFETNGAVSVEKWFHQTITASGSWYNNEVQHYTNRIENSIVGSGILKIVAKKKEKNQGVINNLLLLD